ncbi:inorganic pyrophosphatase [Umbelopsis sp. PMI_123]|nr:inorganic pyrophosphatase [Umbelopsis sp. PMI_123]
MLPIMSATRFPIQHIARMSTYATRVRGTRNTPSHRIYIEQGGKAISPFHDIPLLADADKKIFNMVVEIPRWTNAKIEIATNEFLNPLKQDTKKGKLRFVRNCFPHKGYIWNYGAMPQTWEDPNHIHPDTQAKGDNDPIDVCEIGESVGYTGQVKQVKVLGAMALLDEGETDWKIIAVDINDPLADKLTDIGDVEKHLPGLLEATHQWFRIYKIPDGKPENKFAFGGKAQGRDYATQVVMETHDAWKKLINSNEKEQINSMALANLTINQSPHHIYVDDPSYKAEIAKLEAADKKKRKPSDNDKWFYIRPRM